MNKTILFILAAVVLIGGSALVYTNTQTSRTPNAMQKESAQTQNGDSMMMQEDAMKKDDAMKQKAMMADSNSQAYSEYTKATFDSTADKKRVLFFYASWCPTCRPTDADFKANLAKIPSDVAVIRVNYNDPETDEEEKALAQKYGVTYQHTFVQIDKNGNKVTTWNGGQTEQLLANVK